MIRAGHVPDAPVIPVGPEHVEPTSVTSRQVREKGRKKSMHQPLFKMWHELDNRVR